MLWKRKKKEIRRHVALTELSGETREGSRRVNSLRMAADFIPVRSKENIDDKEEREGERKSEPTDGGFGKASTMPVLQKPVWKEHRPPKHLSRVTVGALAGGTIISAPKDEKTGQSVNLTTEGIW